MILPSIMAWVFLILVADESFFSFSRMINQGLVSLVKHLVLLELEPLPVPRSNFTFQALLDPTRNFSLCFWIMGISFLCSAYFSLIVWICPFCWWFTISMIWFQWEWTLRNHNFIWYCFEFVSFITNVIYPLCPQRKERIGHINWHWSRLLCKWKWSLSRLETCFPTLNVWDLLVSFKSWKVGV